MPGRSRIYVQGEASSGQGESININFEIPFNATFLQITIAIEAVPLILDTMTLSKLSVSGPLFSVEIKRWIPGQIPANFIVCNDHFEYRKGDILSVTYPNTDDLGVGVECVLKEAD